MKGKYSNHNNNNNNNNKPPGVFSWPTVSVCTPTFNRRPFLPYLIQSFRQQTYPLDRMEWIILDDGTDSVRDVFDRAIQQYPELQPIIKYTRMNDTHMTIGAKRNMMNSFCTGLFIVYMDDDDYYPPDRIKHAVTTLLRAPGVGKMKPLVAGANSMYVYYPEDIFDELSDFGGETEEKRRQERDELRELRSLYGNRMVQFGPYRLGHATAATLAFHRDLLKQTSFRDEDWMMEEKAFLKDYKLPMISLNPLDTILVVAHIHNSVNKVMLLREGKGIHAKQVLSSVNPRRFFQCRCQKTQREKEGDEQEQKEQEEEEEKQTKEEEEQDVEGFYLKRINQVLKTYQCGHPNLSKREIVDRVHTLTQERERRHRQRAVYDQLMNRNSNNSTAELVVTTQPLDDVWNRIKQLEAEKKQLESQTERLMETITDERHVAQEMRTIMQNKILELEGNLQQHKQQLSISLSPSHSSQSIITKLLSPLSKYQSSSTSTYTTTNTCTTTNITTHIEKVDVQTQTTTQPSSEGEEEKQQNEEETMTISLQKINEQEQKQTINVEKLTGENEEEEEESMMKEEEWDVIEPSSFGPPMDT